MIDVFFLSRYIKNRLPVLCKFNKAWLEKDCYKRWLKRVGSDWRKAYCIYCKRNIDIASMGEGTLTSHAKGKLI